MFKIKDFAAEIQNRGILRSNRFMVNFNVPKYVRNSGKNTLQNETISLRCESVQMPGLSIAAIDGPPRMGYGPIEATPFGITFDDITLTFIVDARGEIHKFFYLWFSSIINFKARGQTNLKGEGEIVKGMTAYEVGFKDDYVANAIYITMYDATNQKVMTATIYRAFPKLLPSFDLNWGSTDDFVKLSIPFNYTDFEVEYHNPNTKPVNQTNRLT